MPSGILGKSDLPTAGVDALIFTAAAAKVTTANIRVVNRNPASIRVRIAIGSGATPALADYIDYDAKIEPYGILEDMGMVMSGGEKLWVRSDQVGVSVRVHGMEG